MNKKLRRNLLKGLAVGAPAVWAKPIVDSAVLPTYAQTWEVIWSSDDTEVIMGKRDRKPKADSKPTVQWNIEVNR